MQRRNLHLSKIGEIGEIDSVRLKLAGLFGTEARTAYTTLTRANGRCLVSASNKVVIEALSKIGDL